MQTKAKLYSLSNPQKGIWYMEKFFPDTSIACVSATLRLRAPVDFELLERAINYTIRDNDALRLQFTTEDGEPRQYVSPYEYRTFPLKDFRNMEKEALYRWDTEITRRPFFKEDAPLYEIFMLDIDAETSGCLVILHHIITDAWGTVVFGDEFLQRYIDLKNSADDEGVNPEDPVRRPSYLHFIDEEQDYFNSSRFLKDETYWTEMFETFPEPTVVKERNLPETDTTATRRGFIFPRGANSMIQNFIEEHHVTIFVLFLSVLILYLHRISGKDDVVIGVPVLNRTNRLAKITLGMFISTIPFRIQVDGNLLFSDFIHMIAKRWLEVMRHQRYPLEQILRNIRKRGNTNDLLYEVVLSYQNAKFKHDDNSGKISSRWHFSGHQRESLQIHINDRDDSGEMIINYDYLSNLFQLSEISALHSQIIGLIKNAIANPQMKLRDIKLISDEEEQRILTGFNDTKADFPDDKTMLWFFERRVAESPDETCLLFRNQSLTYAQIDQKAEDFARLLRARDIRPGEIVALLFDRSFEMMIAILATWKAGGAYMPINPDYPVERLSYLLDDSKTKALLTVSDTSIPACYRALRINLDEEPKVPVKIRRTPQQEPAGPDDTAYVIYTSGSTGQPKGVMVGHRALVNRINWMERRYPTNSADVILQKTSYTFDVSVWELVWWFYSGVKMVFLEPGYEKLPDRIAEAIEQYKVTIMHFVPSMLGGFLGYLSIFGDAERLHSLRNVFASGEALTPKHVNTFNSLVYPVNGARLRNLYGPTEAAIDVSWYDCPAETEETLVPIGKPIDNIRLYILDKYGNVQPIGVSGELYIGGIGLAKGYLNKPELTAEKFVENPSFPEPRLYKTGDLAKWLPDGNIVFLGRLDFQVKIRGNRIELGDIRFRLEQHPDIAESIITSRQNVRDEAYLIAYYTTTSGNEILLPELRSHLETFLPDYMIPSRFVKIDEIPLSSNGKVNLSLLPDPDIVAPIQPHKREIIRPETLREELVLTAWAEALGHENTSAISITDNFFEIGGDSLSAIDMVCRMPAEIPVSKIYEYPILKDFAQNYEVHGEKRILTQLAGKSKTLRSYVLCPYGGGAAYSYYGLAEAIVHQDPDSAVFAVNLPDHDYGAANEGFITAPQAAAFVTRELVLQGYEYEHTTIYAHCVGAALGIEITRLIELTGRTAKALILGGILPPRYTGRFGSGFDPWKIVSDKRLLKYLNRLGRTEGKIDNAGISSMLRAFRHDVREYYRYIAASNALRQPAFHTPVITILGGDDPLTQKRPDQNAWQMIAGDKFSLRTIESARHYFMQDHATELARIITEKW